MRKIIILTIIIFMLSIPARASTCYDWQGYPSCLPSTETFFHVPPPVTSGWAVYYIPGEMEATAEYRGFTLDDGYLGYVAAMTPAMIGWSVWLKRENHDWEGPYLVVDCPRSNDQYGLIEYKKEVIEVDFNTALRWGFVKLTGLDNQKHYTYQVIAGGEANVQVSYYKPSKYMPPAVIYQNWYKSIFVSGPKQGYIWEDIPKNPTSWCITTKQTCEGRWKTFEQPVIKRRNDDN